MKNKDLTIPIYNKLDTSISEFEKEMLSSENTENNNIYELLDNKNERISILEEEISKANDAIEFKEKVIEDWKFRCSTLEKAIDLLYKFIY